jgi:hypothetical protein
MHENTLSDIEKVADIVNDRLSVLANGEDYALVIGEMAGLKMAVVCVEEGESTYPLFIVPTTEMIASLKDPASPGEPVFRLQNAN